MGCNGMCSRYAIPAYNKNDYQKMKAEGHVFSKRRYTEDRARCSTCNVYMPNTSAVCPCCHYKLRKGPRNRIKRQNVKRIDASDVEGSRLDVSVNGVMENVSTLVAVLEIQNGYKTCYLCKEAKLLELFEKDSRRPFGRGQRCRVCKNAKYLK